MSDDNIPWYAVVFPCLVAVVLLLAFLSPSCSIQIRIVSTPIEQAQ